MDLLTIDAFKKALPKNCRNGIGDDVLEYINGFIKDDPELNGNLKNDVLGYVSVLRDGRYKIKEYINAVRYVGFKLTGDTNIAAYVKTFPDRYQKFVDDGVSERDISSNITAYKNGQLVCKVFAQTIIPPHIFNHDIYQEAINTQAELMRSARSEQVRMKAADSLMIQLRAPETTKIELDIGYKSDDAIEELKRTTAELVHMQKTAIINGMSTAKGIAHSKIISNMDEVEDAILVEEDEL